jgi:hypothetical protein
VRGFQTVSLDISKLKNVCTRSGKTIAGCPACAELGQDRKCEHLVISADGRFGCVIYPGDGPEAKEHRRRIFALCGIHEIKPLIVRRTNLRLQKIPVKTGLWGRLGRHFFSHVRISATCESNTSHDAANVAKPIMTHLKASLPSLPGTLRTGENESSKVLRHLGRPLTEREISILRQAGAENDPVILAAVELFNATIVAVQTDASSLSGTTGTPVHERAEQIDLL